MNSTLQNMLEQHHPKTAEDYRNALKEMIQEIALAGLGRTTFFQECAFYGGTALRIFHGLQRFSEDMDFSLKEPDPVFALEKYLPAIEQELAAYGLQMTAEKKNKTKVSDIQSAFIKGGTLLQVIRIEQQQDLAIPGINKHEQVKIKIEVDTNPPPGATFEFKYTLQPTPTAVLLYDKPSLFAGKIHAVLCRNWQHRIKGRDLYDYVWYIAQNTPVNLFHLQKRLEQSGRWERNKILTLSDVKKLLTARFAQIDFAAAKIDVLPFIPSPTELTLWNESFFTAITEKLREGEQSAALS